MTNIVTWVYTWCDDHHRTTFIMTQYVSWTTLAWILAVIAAFTFGHWMGYWYGRWVAAQECMDRMKEELARKLRQTSTGAK